MCLPPPTSLNVGQGLPGSSDSRPSGSGYQHTITVSPGQQLSVLNTRRSGPSGSNASDALSHFHTDATKHHNERQPHPNIHLHHCTAQQAYPIPLTTLSVHLCMKTQFHMRGMQTLCIITTSQPALRDTDRCFTTPQCPRSSMSTKMAGSRTVSHSR